MDGFATMIKLHQHVLPNVEMRYLFHLRKVVMMAIIEIQTVVLDYAKLRQVGLVQVLVINKVNVLRYVVME